MKTCRSILAVALSVGLASLILGCVLSDELVIDWIVRAFHPANKVEAFAIAKAMFVTGIVLLATLCLVVWAAYKRFVRPKLFADCAKKAVAVIILAAYVSSAQAANEQQQQQVQIVVSMTVTDLTSGQALSPEQLTPEQLAWIDQEVDATVKSLGSNPAPGQYTFTKLGPQLQSLLLALFIAVVVVVVAVGVLLAWKHVRRAWDRFWDKMNARSNLFETNLVSSMVGEVQNKDAAHTIVASVPMFMVVPTNAVPSLPEQSFTTSFVVPKPGEQPVLTIGGLSKPQFADACTVTDLLGLNCAWTNAQFVVDGVYTTTYPPDVQFSAAGNVLTITFAGSTNQPVTTRLEWSVDTVNWSEAPGTALQCEPGVVVTDGPPLLPPLPRNTSLFLRVRASL